MGKESAGSVRFDMKQRIITGACYVAVLAIFFLLREFVNYRIFHLLTYAFLMVGTYELVQMLRPFTERWVGYASLACSGISLPVFLLFEYLIGRNFGMVGYAGVIALCVIGASVYSIVKNEDLKQFGINLLHFIYPSVCMLFFCLANENAYGFIILFTAFVVSPLSDSVAYFTGIYLGKHKLCPKISPKKTWEGAIGGIIGGGVGALLVYLVFQPTLNIGAPWLYFVAIGLVSSVVNIFGDLIESVIKRRVGVKDSGKILPGHGGVLDRIDGTMFAIIPIFFAFLIV